MKRNYDPRYNTMLYCHKDISDNGKPLISNREYKELRENLTMDSYLEAKSKYSIEPKGEKILTDILFKRVI
jgi:hypothetical protein